MIPVHPSGPPPEPSAGAKRRRDLRNYGISLGACALGSVGGALVQRAGWGGQAGTIFAVLSLALGLFCAGALAMAWRR